MDAQTNRVLEITQWFENLTPESLTDISAIYAEQASFCDPFNQIIGLSGIARVYQHMFETLESPRFHITNTVAQDTQAFVVWDFTFEARGHSMKIHGCTHFVLNAQGLISVHRDYWDAAQELYEKLPVLGALMRFLKRKLSVNI